MVKAKAPRRVPAKTKVPAAMKPPADPPVPDPVIDGVTLPLFGEKGNLDPGTASVWQVIGTSRSDDYKFGGTLGGAGVHGNCLPDGSVVRDDFGLAKMGDGSWIPVHKVFLDEATRAVPDLVEYVRRVFPSALESSPATPKGDFRDRLDDGDVGRPDPPSHRPPEKPPPPADDLPPAGALPAADTKDDDVRTLAVTWDEHGERYKAWREVVAESSR